MLISKHISEPLLFLQYNLPLLRTGTTQHLPFRIFAFDISSSYRFTRIFYMIYPFVWASLFHLSFHFPAERRAVQEYPWIQTVPYLFSPVFAVMLMALFYSARDFWIMLNEINFVMVAVGGIFVVGSSFITFRESYRLIEKLRAKLILYSCFFVALTDFTSMYGLLKSGSSKMASTSIRLTSFRS